MIRLLRSQEPRGSAYATRSELRGERRPAGLLAISDARMSDTPYGAVVLHVAPEAAVGGPLALVHSGDRIRLDVASRSLDFLRGTSDVVTELVAYI
jgi:dihydroxyacid dehydratase/phosphogluconate dehydratase